MSKQLRMKRKMIMTLAASAAAVGFGVLLAGGTSYYATDLEEAERRLTMQHSSMQSSHTDILQKFEDGQKLAAKFKEINPSGDPLFGTLDRKKASLLLESLNQRYKLKSLSLDISPAALQVNPPYQRKSGGLNTSTVKISFESMTDEYAYSVMRDMIASFPGFLRLSSLNLTKNASIDDSVLYAVQNGEIPPKVKSEIALDWLGVEIKNNDASNAPAAAMAAPQ